jgi:hypothetical protein
MDRFPPEGFDARDLEDLSATTEQDLRRAAPVVLTTHP